MQPPVRVAHPSRVLAIASRNRGLPETLFRRDAETNTRDACATPNSNAKRFARHFHAQSLEADELIPRSLFECIEINSLEFWKICRDRLERMPKKSFSCNSEGQPFNGLKQLDAVPGIAKLCPPEFFGHPRADLANRAFFGPDFLIQITQLLLVGVNLFAQI